jgi:hypothetical protein
MRFLPTTSSRSRRRRRRHQRCGSRAVAIKSRSARGHTPSPGGSTCCRGALSTDKNGRATLDLTAPAIAPDATVNGKTAGCPNGRWTGIDPVISEQSATLTITQRGQVIYTQTIDF